MKSFTGKITSRRGWILLLAVLLGAGMMISACGDEEDAGSDDSGSAADNPDTAAGSRADRPRRPRRNLRVSASTSTSITWTWGRG